jgi:hypothetical protein
VPEVRLVVPPGPAIVSDARAHHSGRSPGSDPASGRDANIRVDTDVDGAKEIFARPGRIEERLEQFSIADSAGDENLVTLADPRHLIHEPLGKSLEIDGGPRWRSRGSGGSPALGLLGYQLRRLSGVRLRLLRRPDLRFLAATRRRNDRRQWQREPPRFRPHGQASSRRHAAPSIQARNLDKKNASHLISGRAGAQGLLEFPAPIFLGLAPPRYAAARNVPRCGAKARRAPITALFGRVVGPPIAAPAGAPLRPARPRIS